MRAVSGPLQITKLSAAPVADTFPGGVRAAAAALSAPADEVGLDRQLKAYQELAGRWRQAGQGERQALAQALTDSPFGQKVQSTLDAFTRAAWAGSDAAPPAPQAQVLKAFDDLSDTDRQIVAAMQVDARGAPAFASADDYRARLQADLAAAEAATGQKRDTVTLSRQAQAHLAGGAAPEAQTPEPAPHPAVAAAFAAYGRASR
jgi:hypothetical protein